MLLKRIKDGKTPRFLEAWLLKIVIAANIICPDKFIAQNNIAQLLRNPTIPIMTTKITLASQFIDVQGRRVLVRYAGAGPAVVLLHQSPQSSRSLIPWITRLAEHYAVFAPDTPGFGLSDPLALAQPTIPDYAAALNSLLETLGIAKTFTFWCTHRRGNSVAFFP
ncbi:MAG: hypothetical protein HC782_02365 [Gammaproteobacteria bacterium]|nr:hypothetical protein [Gammaproteobacteria bacterium]